MPVITKPKTTAESDDDVTSVRSLTFKEHLSKKKANPEIKNKRKNWDF